METTTALVPQQIEYQVRDIKMKTKMKSYRTPRISVSRTPNNNNLYIDNMMMRNNNVDEESILFEKQLDTVVIWLDQWSHHQVEYISQIIQE